MCARDSPRSGFVLPPCALFSPVVGSDLGLYCAVPFVPVHTCMSSLWVKNKNYVMKVRHFKSCSDSYLPFRIKYTSASFEIPVELEMLQVTHEPR